jgi:hypothetical protein
VKLQFQKAISLRQTESFEVSNIKSAEPFGLWAIRRNILKKEKKMDEIVTSPT